MNEVNSLSIIDQADITTFKETMQKITQWQKLVQENLKEGKDYGIIPGTSKPTLYKSGAEKIFMLGKLRSTFDILDETKDWEKEFFQFELRWNLWAGENLICQGIGLCSSKEDKYRYRWVSEKKLPNNIKKEDLVYRVKSGKYGDYKQYRVENEDICSIANTILKMAKKRSEVDAALLVGSLSELFTQDVEDLPEEYLVNEKTTTHNNKDNGGNGQEAEVVTVTEKAISPETNNRPSEIQMKQIYGEVVCEDCGIRVYGFKCPKCENSIKNEKLHVISLGFLHSHLLTKADIKAPGKMTPAMDPGKLTKSQAIDIWDWWMGSKEKLILGERKRREEKLKATKAEPTRAENLAIARHIAGGGKLELKEGSTGLLDDEEIVEEGKPGGSINNAIPRGKAKAN